MRQYYRWSDNDHHFGPIIYARDTRGYRPFTVMLCSGHDETPGCRLRLSAFGHTLIFPLPQIIKPHRTWHVITTEPTRSRMIANGREPGYWEEYQTEYGFTAVEGSFHWHYGAQTHSSDTDKTKVWFFPWREHKCIRHSVYDLEGDLFADLPEWGFRNKNGWAARNALQDACPTMQFDFADFDGEKIVATCRIEEREWRRGKGLFRLFYLGRNKVSRSLDLRFSAEVGKRKGSWKGGTIGHSIDMLPGELHEAAFRRYCDKEKLTYGEPVVVIAT